MALLPGFGPTLAQALEMALAPLLGGNAEIDGPRVRIQTTAATEALLPAALMAVIADTAESFSARAIGIQIDGIRPVDGGYRLWGLVQIDPNQPARAIPTPETCSIARDGMGFFVTLAIETPDL